MAAAFLVSILAALVAILALAPMYIGIIQDAQEAGAERIADTTKSEWHIYILGCVLTAFFSFDFSLIISHYL